MNLEQELRRSLRKEPPPAGFADRVAARIAKGPAVQATVPRHSSRGMWLALAASLTIAVTSGWMYEQHRTRVEREHAAEQVQLALRIAGQTLADVQVRLAEISRR